MFAPWAVFGCKNISLCACVISAFKHSNSHTTSKPDICKTGSFGIKLQTQQLRKVIFQLSHPLLTSYGGCCCVLYPSKNQITSWAVASMRVAGDLSHLSVKVLLSRHRWKAWSFAFFFTTGTLLSSLPNMSQQNRAMTHPLVFALLRHRRLLQRPILDFFPKMLNPTAISWPPFADLKKEHSNSHFSEPWVQSDQYLRLLWM